MKYLHFISGIGLMLMITSCHKPLTNLTYENPDKRIIFLHHSTGKNVWYGDLKQNKRYFGRSMCMVPRLIKEYNDKNGTKLSIEEQNFPNGNPYPWENFPFDYYNIWVKNSGDSAYIGEPTLEMLTKAYDIIIFKHCFPVSSILADDQEPDINSTKKTLANYKLQYDALKNKFLEYPKHKFIIWTGAALVKLQTNEEEGTRAKEFSEWVKNDWDQPDDNIFVFDFRDIETEGGLYLKPEYCSNESDSHPNKYISVKSGELFVKMLIDVAKGN